MTNANTHPDKPHVSAIEKLCDEFELSGQEIAAVYREEFNRLAAAARISTFLEVLAMTNTRSILRRVRGRVVST